MAESNLITTETLSNVTAREVEFTLNFVEGIQKLQEALGVTRLIQKQAGTVLKAYKATGTLEAGAVDEGETIPLSQYALEAIVIDEATLNKWRKATTAEAINATGYDYAVTLTSEKMLSQVQKAIRTKLFNFLSSAEGTTSASGDTFQAALAQAWGQLEVLFEDYDGVDPIYFVNPLDIADYLANATITTQDVFGMTYIENFLGLGSVLTNTSVPQGTVYATAKSNIIGYYVPVNGADLGNAFEFTSDQTGMVGIHEFPDYTNMTAQTTVVSGVAFYAELVDGIVVATIGASDSGE